jgi:hypothetical protein
MRVSGVQVLDGFILEEGAVGYLCVEVCFAADPNYMFVYVVGVVDGLPMLHVHTQEDAKAVATSNRT